MVSRFLWRSRVVVGVSAALLCFSSVLPVFADQEDVDHVIFIPGGGGGGDSAGLEPVADTTGSATQDHGIVLRLPMTDWNHALLKFDLSTVAEPIESAILRVYYDESQSATLNLWPLLNDNWDENTQPPAQESANNDLISSLLVNEEGYVDFDVSDFVIAQNSGDQFASFELGTASPSVWKHLLARESAHPPLLVFNEQPAPPVLTTLSVSPASGEVTVGDGLQFTASGLDQHGDSIASDPQWSVSGGGSIDSNGYFSADTVGGPFTVTATEGDVTSTVQVTVLAEQAVNQPPVVSFTFTPETGVAPLQVQFSSSANDVDGQIQSYQWDFGDGGSSLFASPQHTFAQSGSYTVQLTVTDNQGAATTVSQMLVVKGSEDSELYSMSLSPLGSRPDVGEVIDFDVVGKDQYGADFPVSPTWSVTGGGTITQDGVFTATTVGGPFEVIARKGHVVVATRIYVEPAQAALASIVITPSIAQVTVGQSVDFDAQGRDQQGNNFATNPVWSVSGGGAITSDGVFTATAAGGPFTVTATDGDVVSTAQITVEPEPAELTTMTVTPANAQPVVGETIDFDAMGRDQYGDAFPASPVWTVSGGGTIDADGVFSATTAGGPFTVTATEGSIVATVQVNVSPEPAALSSMAVTPTNASPTVGQTVEFEAVGQDQYGDAFPVNPVWSVSGGGTITSDGVFTATAAGGPFTVTATDGDVTATAQFTVSPEPAALVSMEITPETAEPTVGQTVDFSAVGTDQYGDAFPTNPVWTVSGGGNISAEGVFTATTAGGPFTVIATDGGVVATAQVTVAPEPAVLSAMSVTPVSAQPVVGQAVDFDAVGTDQYGEAFPVNPVWTVSGGGTINADGVFAATTAGGPFTVTATDGSVVATAQVTVSPEPAALSSIAISPMSAQPIVGQTIGFNAVGTDQYGEAFPVNPVWTVSGGGTINADGVFTATTTGGPFTVTATDGSVVATAQVTVSPEPAALSSIAISPMSAQPIVGQTIDFNAVGTDQYGDNFPVNPVWTVSGGGTISADGVFTATDAGGPFIVTATDGSVSQTVQILVQLAPPVVSSLVITPDSASVPEGETVDFNVVIKDQYGDPIAATPVWSVSGGGTIDENGLFTADSEGGPFVVTVAVGGVESTVEITVEPPVVINEAPVASFSATPETGVAPVVIQFESTSTDSDGVIVAYLWDFGDGTTLSTSSPAKTFTQGGSYQVQLTVTDDKGAQDTVMSVIDVDPAPVGGGSSTLEPVQDTSTASNHVLGKSEVLPVSAWDHTMLRFDLAEAGEPIESATLRVYFMGEGEETIKLWPLSNDDWTEEGEAPAEEYQQHDLLGEAVASGPGYIEFDVSAYVAQEKAADGVASFELGTDLSSWLYLASRESNTPPQLVIEGGSTEPPADAQLQSLVLTPAPSLIQLDDVVNFAVLGKDQYGGDLATDPQWSVSGGGVITDEGIFTATTIGGPFTLTVQDGSVVQTLVFSITDGTVVNQPPVALFMATPDSGVAPLTVQFVSTSTDSDGQVVAYSWDFGDGTASVLQAPGKTFAAAGNYNVELTVTDDLGLTDSMMSTIVVEAAAVGGEVSLQPIHDQATFAGLGSSATLPVSMWDHTVLMFDVAEASVPITSAILRVYYLGDETATLNLWPLLNDSWTEDGIPPAKEAPFADLLGTAVVSEEGYVEFDVSDFVVAQRDGDQVVSFELGSSLNSWVFVGSKESGTPPQLVIESGSTTPPEPAKLTSIDLTPKIAQIGLGDQVPFTAVGKDQYGNVFASSPVWSVSGGGNVNTGGMFTATTIGGPFVITVQDGDVTASVTFTVVDPAVVNEPPTAAFVASNLSGVSPLEVVFTSQSSDSDGEIASFAWDFGDGTSSILMSPAKVFNSVGSYDVTLTVVDDDGASDATTQTIEVLPEPVTGTVSLAPVQDVATFPGWGTEGQLPVSSWDHSALQFDLAGLAGSVTSATLRVFFDADDAMALKVWPMSNDNWTETGTAPASEHGLSDAALGSVGVTGAGYVEFDVTDYVAAQKAGDEVASFELGSDWTSWRFISSREGTNPPELIVETGL